MKNRSRSISNRIVNKHHPTFLLLLLLALFSISDKPAEADQKPVAKVNGTILMEADLQEALNTIMPASVFHGGFSSEKRMQYRPCRLWEH